MQLIFGRKPVFQQFHPYVGIQAYVTIADFGGSSPPCKITYDYVIIFVWFYLYAGLCYSAQADNILHQGWTDVLSPLSPALFFPVLIALLPLLC